MNLDYRMSKEQAKQQIQLFRTLYDDVKIEKAEQRKNICFFRRYWRKRSGNKAGICGRKDSGANASLCGN